MRDKIELDFLKSSVIVHALLATRAGGRIFLILVVPIASSNLASRWVSVCADLKLLVFPARVYFDFRGPALVELQIDQESGKYRRMCAC